MKEYCLLWYSIATVLSASLCPCLRHCAAMRVLRLDLPNTHSKRNSIFGCCEVVISTESTRKRAAVSLHQRPTTMMFTLQRGSLLFLPVTITLFFFRRFCNNRIHFYHLYPFFFWFEINAAKCTKCCSYFTLG